MRKFLPLIRLPKGYYNVKYNVKYNNSWSPWNFPPRKKKVILGMLFDWVLIIALFLITEWLFKYSSLPEIPYFSINDDSLKKPVVDEIIPASLATLLSTILPACILILVELIFFFDIWDFYHMLIGHITSIGFSLFFTSLGWGTIGGQLSLRPTFLTKCQPNSTILNLNPNVTYFANDVCTETLGNTEFQGFPSGHSATAYGGWLFFVLYINGKAKPWLGGAYLWKVLILCLPLYFATWVSITRINDFRHFPFQIISGGIVGVISALVSYRLHFGNADWFIGGNGYLDHIPAHYKFKEDWYSEEEDNKMENNQKGTPRVIDNNINNNVSNKNNNLTSDENIIEMGVLNKKNEKGTPRVIDNNINNNVSNKNNNLTSDENIIEMGVLNKKNEIGNSGNNSYNSNNDNNNSSNNDVAIKINN